MQRCYTCSAPNSDEKTHCYSCGQSLTTPPPAQGVPPQSSYTPSAPPSSQYPSQAPAQPPALAQSYAPPPIHTFPTYPQQPGMPQPYGQAPPLMPQQYSSQNQMSPPGLAAREKEIIAKYSAQIRSMLLVVVVAILVGAGVAYGLKCSQTTLGLPNVLWVCLPVAGLLVFAGSLYRCPNCKTSLMKYQQAHNEGICPECNARFR